MDKLTITRGITRYSSDGWDVRIFIADPGVQLLRGLAPEINHAGLLLVFGSSQMRPTIMRSHMPLFREDNPFPETLNAGAIFMTASEDDLSEKDLRDLSDMIFLGESKVPNPRLKKASSLFQDVLKNAFHKDA